MFDIEGYIEDFSELNEPMAKELWVHQYERMAIHTREKKPTHIIEAMRPYEDQVVRDYRLDNYVPITKSIITRGIESLQRVFKSSVVDARMSDSLREYIEGQNFKGTDLHSYINKYVLKRMIEDPNGVLMWWPTFNREEILQTQKNFLQPLLVYSREIIHFNSEILTVKSQEKSMVKVKAGSDYIESMEGVVYYISTRDTYYKYSQYGKKEDNNFELFEVYKHNLGEVPANVLGGYESSTDLLNEKGEETGEEVYYLTSYFSAFLAWGEEAIRQFSENQGTKVVCAFPMREVSSVDCPTCEGKGKVYGKDAQGVQYKQECKTCSGKGYTVPGSPYGVLVKPKQGLDDEIQDVPMLQYITPPTEILDFQSKEFQSLLREAEKSLSILFVEDTQSGIAKEIDREALYAMLDQIGVNVYNIHYKKALNYISKVSNFGTEEVYINVPQTFRTKTEQELAEELTTLKEKGAPAFMLSEIAMELYRKRFSNDPVRLKQSEVVALVDPFFFYDQNEKSTMLASGGMSDEEYAISIKAPARVSRIANYEKVEFMEKDAIQIAEQVTNEIKQTISTTPPLID